MKTPRLTHHARCFGMTRIELVVTIFIIAVLAGFIFPVFSRPAKKGRVSDSLNNAKEIALALRRYAGDHDGRFPFARMDGTPLEPGDFSNRALEQLMPKYCANKKLFFQKVSAWCRYPSVDSEPADAALLKKGQNDWNYVAGLSVKSNPRWPLFATATVSASDLNYTNDRAAKGGVWFGGDAVIGYADASARHLYDESDMNLTNNTKTFPKRPDNGANIFIATPEWLGTGALILAPE